MCTASSLVAMECKRSIQLLLLIFTSCSAQSTYYVTPVPDVPCPGEPCLTLSEYVADQHLMNLPVNTTMEFLPGNHTLDQIISVTNVTWLTLHGDSSSLPGITSRIVCTQPAGFVFTGITELYISSLAFISCGHNGIAAVNITSVQQCNISSCSFYSNVNVDRSECDYDYGSGYYFTPECGLGHVYAKGGALYIQDSNILLTDNLFQNNSATAEGGVLYGVDSNLTVTDNTFQSNSAEAGGVLYVWDSTLTVSNNTFQSNSAGDGGVLFVGYSNLTVTDNTFQDNSAELGGVLFVGDSNLTFTDNTFQSNSATSNGGVLAVKDSALTVTDNTFQNNSAEAGGVLFVGDSNLTFTDNTFQSNSATSNGGVLAVKDSTLTVTDNTVQNNSAEFGGVLSVVDSTLTVTGNTFQNNSAEAGGVLFVEDSTLTVTDNTFQNNSAEAGGVLAVGDSNLTVTDNTFQNNSATSSGGVLTVKDSNLTVTDNTFQNNSAKAGQGGVLFVGDSNLTVTDNIFQNNSAKAGRGGVLLVGGSNLTVTNNTFQNNSAEAGGVLSVLGGNLTVTDNTFQNNFAEVGGVLFAVDSTLTVTDNTFQNNSATVAGGVLSVLRGNFTVTDNTFQKNSAVAGGVLYVEDSNLTVTDNAFQSNSAIISGGVLDVEDSNLTVTDNTCQKNSAEAGGVLFIADSNLTITDSIFQNNYARYGGGLYVHSTASAITGNVILINNSATEDGGGMYVLQSTVIFTGNTTIMNNSAIDGNGGGLLLSVESQLYLQPNANVSFISNSAKSSGGAIMIAESNPLAYCIDSVASFHQRSSDCFFQINTLEKYKNYTTSDLKSIINGLNIGLYFDTNSAETGADLHGGAVDNCRVKNLDTRCSGCSSGVVFDDITTNKLTLEISSDPLYICTCSDHRLDCTTGSYHPEPVYPGGTLEVPVIARGQRSGTTPAVIQIISPPNSNITLTQENENVRNIRSTCTTLKYIVQSSEENTIQHATLYVQGPCLPTMPNTLIPTMSNTLKISVKILNCPSGFQLSDTQPICICTKRLQHFTNSCLIDDRTIHRMKHAQFWVGYDDDSDGIILHPHCPFDYCTSEETYLAVDDSDKQCNYNRSGLLCGRCKDNLSLALGSSRCLQCSNSYLSLLAAFAFAGIALVLLLLVLRLTVAAGAINGLIFYANIVEVNSAIFFQPQTSNVPTGLITKLLTLFIAWLNLDLGIETCFYNGMDAYVKTWLQFASPLYVWALIGMIILGSHYSGRVAKVFGSNPVAVLATLFLLSYAKLLHTVIAALSYTSLQYPNNSRIAVWLYDGNIRYLGGKHIPLFTVAMVCLIFLVLPYTILLIFGQWLQAKSGLKIFSCINNRYVKPFLDAYHAPYTNKHRYWTGLMLLLRFVLLLISAVDALGDPSVNLLATVSTTAAILTLTTILSSRIYKSWILSLLETSFTLNLTILAAATLYIRPSGGNQNAATFTSVGISFTIFVGIIIYHSVQLIKGTRLWRRVCVRHDYMRVTLTDVDSGPEDPPGSPVNLAFTSGSAPTQTVVDIRDSELREPCMETD